MCKDGLNIEIRYGDRSFKNNFSEESLDKILEDDIPTGLIAYIKRCWTITKYRKSCDVCGDPHMLLDDKECLKCKINKTN